VTAGGGHHRGRCPALTRSVRSAASLYNAIELGIEMAKLDLEGLLIGRPRNTIRRPPTARIRWSSASDVMPAYDWRTFLFPDALGKVRG
jgi:hypothetical protein